MRAGSLLCRHLLGWQQPRRPQVATFLLDITQCWPSDLYPEEIQRGGNCRPFLKSLFWVSISYGLHPFYFVNNTHIIYICILYIHIRTLKFYSWTIPDCGISVQLLYGFISLFSTCFSVDVLSELSVPTLAVNIGVEVLCLVVGIYGIFKYASSVLSCVVFPFRYVQCSRRNIYMEVLYVFLPTLDLNIGVKVICLMVGVHIIIK